jgi:hypothetical protein
MQTQRDSILRETIAMIGTILGSELDEIAIERVVIGLFFTGVKLSNGVAGTSATPIKSIPEAVCCPSSAMAMPFPGKLHGRWAADPAREALSGDGIGAPWGSPQSMPSPITVGSGGRTRMWSCSPASMPSTRPKFGAATMLWWSALSSRF